jgi:hypothetical protein
LTPRLLPNTAACSSPNYSAATLTVVSGGARAHCLVALLFHRQHYGMRGVTSKPRRLDVLLDRHDHVNLGEFQGEDALAKDSTFSGTPNLAGERK